MKYCNPPYLFTLLLGALLLPGCASTGTTPGSETTSAAAPATVEAAPAPTEKPKTKKKAAPGGAEPECD